MIRKFVFWAHLALGISAGAFILIMSATGVALAFEKQIIDFVDRDIRSVAVPNNRDAAPVSDLLAAIRRAGTGEPTSITVRNAPEAATQFSIGREKTIYVDQYSGAILGASSAAAHRFFFAVERLHRSLGAPLGSKGIGHWLTAISNLLFAGLIPLGIALWLPRKWSWTAIRASIAFRGGLRGRARDWSWHNVLGIWCAAPLLVIALTGVVMSFPWANSLLFRLSGSNPPVRGRGPGDARPHSHGGVIGSEPKYDRLLEISKSFDRSWRTITLNTVRDLNSPVQVSVETGTGGQPQKRTQYLLNGNSGTVLRTTRFADASLGQRLRSFVRFGHTGEWGGWAGQLIASVVSFAACVLVYTGLSLSIRRLLATLKRTRGSIVGRVPRPEQSLVKSDV